MDDLAAAGIEHSEVSNFAKQGKRCRHNECYWLGDEYYAAGPGASRYLNGVRSTNHRSTTAYLNRLSAGRSPWAESEELSRDERALEVLVFALRRLEGVGRTWFLQKTGTSLDTLLGDLLPPLVRTNLVIEEGDRIRLSRDGLLVSDSIFSRFLRSHAGNSSLRRERPTARSASHGPLADLHTGELNC
jgi:oxygen-independent coproporphyrinogen-3 oxidase